MKRTGRTPASWDFQWVKRPSWRAGFVCLPVCVDLCVCVLNERRSSEIIWGISGGKRINQQIVWWACKAEVFVLRIHQQIFQFDWKRAAHQNKLFNFFSVEQRNRTTKKLWVFVWERERERVMNLQYSTFQSGVHLSSVQERSVCHKANTCSFSTGTYAYSQR